MNTTRYRRFTFPALFVILAYVLVCGWSAADEQMAASDKLRIVYFTSSSCPDCQRVKAFLPQVLAPWGDHVALELHSVDDISVFKKLFAYEKHYAVEVNAPPAIFVGDKALVGEQAIRNGLDDAIITALADRASTFNHASESSEMEVPPAVAVKGSASDGESRAKASTMRLQFVLLSVIVVGVAAIGFHTMRKASGKHGN